MAVLLMTGGAAAAESQQPDLPVVLVDGPTVIMFASHPDSVLDPEARASLFSALDQQQGEFADARAELSSMGVTDAVQLSTSFFLQDDRGRTLFEASPDSATIGVVIAAPGRPFRVIYRVQFRETLLEAVRAFLN